MATRIVQGTEFAGDYDLGGEAPITLSVWIGEGNTGAILIELEGETVEEGHDELREVELGTASALRGKTLAVYTSVSHVNPQSSRTSVSHELEGGRQRQTVVLRNDVDTPGDVVDCKATFGLGSAGER